LSALAAPAAWPAILSVAKLSAGFTESSSRRQRQPNPERHTRTVNFPQLPAETAKDAYGDQNSRSETNLGP
jgi:hypothetical protein